MSRIRTPSISGNLSDAALGANGAQVTMTSPGLAKLPAIAAPDTASIILDPMGQHGLPEVVYVTGHAGGAQVATVTRAAETGGGLAPAAREHKKNEYWVHGPTTTDWALLVETLTAADGTIVVGGTVKAPTLRVGSIAQSQVTGLIAILNTLVANDVADEASIATILTELASKVDTGDARLSDERVPTDGSVTDAKVDTISEGKITGLVADLAGKVSKAAQRIYLPADYGAVPSRYGADIHTTSGLATVTSADAVFGAGDVGKHIAIKGAGAAGAALLTTILSVQDATHATLTIAAGTTVNPAVPNDTTGFYSGWWMIYTDASAAVQAAIDAASAAGGGVVQINDVYAANVVVKPWVHIQGLTPRQSRLVAVPGSSTAVIGSNSADLTYLTHPHQNWITDLWVDGSYQYGSTAKGIELVSPNGDAYAGPLPLERISPVDVSSEPHVCLRNITITNCGADGLTFGVNMRNSFCYDVVILHCIGYGLVVRQTDSEFSNMSIGVCSDGMLVTGKSNRFSKMKLWYAGRNAPFNTGAGAGMIVANASPNVAQSNQFDSIEFNDCLNYGLVLDSRAWGNVFTGCLCNGNGVANVRMHGDVVGNYVPMMFSGADLDSAPVGFLIDGVFAASNWLVAIDREPNAQGAGYVAFSHVNGATSTQNMENTTGSDAMDAPAGFVGNLLDRRVNGVSVFSVTQAGVLQAAATIRSLPAGGNGIIVTGAAAGAGVELRTSTLSADANIDIKVTPRGTGVVALGTHKITGLVDGTASTDAATKGQVDAAQAAAVASSAQRASDLSDLASAATARTNLGLGTAAVHAHGDYDASGAAAAAQAAALQRANHTGTQLAATVSDFDTQVRTSRLDQMAAPTAALPAIPGKLQVTPAAAVVGFEVKQAAAPSAHAFDVSSSAGTGDIFAIDQAGAVTSAGSINAVGAVRAGTPTTGNVLSMTGSSASGVGVSIAPSATLSVDAVVDFTLAPRGSGGLLSLGSATSHKIGFYGGAGAARPANANQAAVAATAATNAGPYGYTQAQADAIVTLLNAIRTALVNVNLIKGSA